MCNEASYEATDIHDSAVYAHTDWQGLFTMMARLQKKAGTDRWYSSDLKDYGGVIIAYFNGFAVR